MEHKQKKSVFISPIKKIKTRYHPNKEKGIGNPDTMFCAKLREVIQMRDNWLDDRY